MCVLCTIRYHISTIQKGNFRVHNLELSNNFFKTRCLILETKTSMTVNELTLKLVEIIISKILYLKDSVFTYVSILLVNMLF